MDGMADSIEKICGGKCQILKGDLVKPPADCPFTFDRSAQIRGSIGVVLRATATVHRGCCLHLTGDSAGEAVKADHDSHGSSEDDKYSPSGVRAEKPRSSGRVMSDRWYSMLLITPAMIIIFIFALFPLFYAINLSFRYADLTNPKGIGGFVGLENYREVLNDPVVWESAWRTLIFTFFSVSLEMILGIALAFQMNKMKWLKGLSRALLLLPLAAAPIAVGLVWRYMYHMDFGVFNALLGMAGLPPQNWLGDLNLAMPSVVLFDVWQWTPFVAVITLAGLQALPKEPFEASEAGRRLHLAGIVAAHVSHVGAGALAGLRSAHHRRHSPVRCSGVADPRRPWRGHRGVDVLPLPLGSQVLPGRSGRSDFAIVSLCDCRVYGRRSAPHDAHPGGTGQARLTRRGDRTHAERWLCALPAAQATQTRLFLKRRPPCKLSA